MFRLFGKSSHSNHFDWLPTELQDYVFQLLEKNYQDLIHFSLVCKHWNDLSQFSLIWKRLGYESREAFINALRSVAAAQEIHSKKGSAYPYTIYLLGVANDRHYWSSAIPSAHWFNPFASMTVYLEELSLEGYLLTNWYEPEENTEDLLRKAYFKKIEHLIVLACVKEKEQISQYQKLVNKVDPYIPTLFITKDETLTKNNERVVLLKNEDNLVSFYTRVMCSVEKVATMLPIQKKVEPDELQGCCRIS